MTRLTETILLAAALALSPAVLAEDPKAPPAGATSGGMSDAVMVKATVEAIDLKARTITIKGPKGNVRTFPVDAKIKNLDKIKVGDEIRAAYYEALAWDLRKAGQPTAESGIKESGVAAKGGGEGAIGGVREVTLVATVVGIDPKAPSVTLKEPEGKITEVKVKDPKKLEGVVVGDKVEIRFTQALAISLDKPAPVK
ncbi:MAG TPA: hypothetical protein VLH41_09800 [Thermoanaerobaculia bacterium]|nr:hypothetical protein [Thermoanaerobaculia bacterium]